MSQWALMLLGGPGAPAPLLKPATRQALWTPQTIAPPYFVTEGYRTHFSTYGLGWFLQDELGYQTAVHSGSDIGMRTKVALLPELHLGIVVLTNTDSGGFAAFTAISSFIEDYYLGLHGRDRVQEMLDLTKTHAADADQIAAAAWQQVAAAQKAVPKKPDYRAYLGRYHDAWFGDVNLYQQGNQLWLQAKRSPRLLGQVLPYRGNTCAVRWKDRSLYADAFATFTLNEQGRATGFQMKPISPATDFSFDFQDLDLQRVPETAAVK